jgi:predicted transposase YbfD/YdcC
MALRRSVFIVKRIQKIVITIGTAGILLCTGCSAPHKPDVAALREGIKYQKACQQEATKLTKQENKEKLTAITRNIEEMKASPAKLEVIAKANGEAGESEEQYISDMQQHKLNWIQNQIAAEEQERNRKRIAMRIDIWLGSIGSPLAGYGPIFVREGERTGINPYLSVAIAKG